MDFGRQARIITGLAALTALGGCGSLDSAQSPDPRADLLDLRITEIHYHPSGEDGVAADEFEFLEIKNTGASTLDLSGVGFTEGIDYAFADGTTLPPGGILVLAARAPRFQDRYGFEPEDVYVGTLANSGETLVLEDLASRTVIDSITYADGGDWPALADGGYSLVPVSAGEPAKGWRASFRPHGSPGRDDRIAPVINEVSTHTDPPASDAIELYNPDDAPADVGGWFLSDDRDVPAKFRIPPGTTIPAKGYLVFDETDFNSDSTLKTSFTLNSHGEEVWLSADSLGCRGYCHGFAFGESENGATFGRLVTAGGEHFPIQKRSSLGKANAGPHAGPVVISEVMYHAANDTDDYLEIVNTGSGPVPLFDPDHPAHTWKIEGMGFRFPAGITLASGETVLVLPARASETRIRAAYGVPDAVRIFQATGDLGNSSDTLALMKPAEPYVKSDAAPGDTTVPFLRLDEVTYLDSGAWPKSADGEGKALGRASKDMFGGDPAAWTAVPPGPGR